MAPVVDRLKTEYEGKVEFRLLNADTDPDAASLGARVAVQDVPTFVLLDSDGTQRDMIVGEVSEDDLRAALDALR